MMIQCGYFLLALLSCVSSNSGLRNVFVIWRHGDRSPYQPFISNPDNWPEGYSVLTNDGILQQYNLGLFLRNKYQNFVPDVYNYTNYYIRSSDTDRTLMSAAANVAGFYSKDPRSTGDFQWRPLPIHTQKSDREYLFSNYYCRRLYKIVEDIYTSSETDKFLDKFSTTISLIKKNLGKINRMDLQYLYDDVLCNKIHKFQIPSWISPEVEKDLREMSEHFWAQWVDNEEKVSFQTGIFAREFVDHIRKIIKTGVTTEPIDGHNVEMAKNHIIALSGHDVNINALMAMFGHKVTMPEYASCIMVELYGPELPGDLDMYFFNVRYKSGPKDSTGELIKLPYCDTTSCPANKVLAHVEKYAMDKDTYLRRCEMTPSTQMSGSKIAMIVIGTLAGVGIVGVIIYFGFIRNH